jgi:hypothetical protein
MDARDLVDAQRGDRPYAARHLKLVFEEFDYGFIYKRVPASARAIRSGPSGG